MTHEHPTNEADNADHTSEGNRLSVYGTIRHNAGRPIPDATVTLADISGQQLDVTRTDATGGYRLTSATSGTRLVIAAAAGWQPTVSLVAVGNRAVRQDLTLVGDGGVAGRLTLSGSGRAVADGVVTVADSQGDIVGVTRSGADGEFTIRKLVAGSYTLVAGADPFHPVAQAIDIQNGTILDIDVELAATSSITGVVVDTNDEPFPGARVELLDAHHQILATETTHDDGVFTFEDLSHGDYALVANGYGPAVAPLDIDAQQTRHVDLTLQSPTLAVHKST